MNEQHSGQLTLPPVTVGQAFNNPIIKWVLPAIVSLLVVLALSWARTQQAQITDLQQFRAAHEAAEVEQRGARAERNARYERRFRAYENAQQAKDAEWREVMSEYRTRLRK